jgi:glycosyltransferase involved in cell wall biosynthesis
MTNFDERVNGLRWRLRAMRRLWSGGAKPHMTFLAPEPTEENSMGRVDHPLPGMEIEGEALTVSGWAAFKSVPTGRVEVWMDDHELGRARLGLPRVDIEETTEMANGATSGFELTTGIGQILKAGPGERATIRVVAIGTNGDSHELDPIQVTFGDPKPPPEPASIPLPIPVRPGEGRGLRTMVVTHQLNLGGAQLYLMDLLRGLKGRGGFDLTVISAMDGPLRQELEAMGIPVHISSMLPLDDLNSHLGRVDELTAWAKPHGFELAFINTATAPAFPGAEVAARLGIPAVWAIHESLEPAILWAGFEPKVRTRAEAALSAAAFAVFEAEATQRIFEPLLDSSRSLTLPYGLDMIPIDQKRASFDQDEARHQAGVATDARLILCMGTIEPRKAQIPLAQAFELIADHHPDAHLAFVGGRKQDPHSRALEECIGSSPHGGQMKLVPITPDVDLWYGMADLLVCASDVESLPRTVLEAMAWETPVLATEIFGLPELIEHGENGWLCQPRDISRLAEALDEVLSTPPEVHDRIAARARALVQERHSLERYAGEMADLLIRAKI